MLWFRRRPDTASGGGGIESVQPVDLAVELDPRVFGMKFRVLLEALADTGGIDAFLAALATKSTLFAEALAPGVIDDLDLGKVEILLETIMPARKRVWPSLVAAGDERVRAAIKELLYGKQALQERMEAFVAALPVAADLEPKAARTLRRALGDFGAELLHFRAPIQYPLMTRWVWDQATHAGALRELVKGGDALDKVELGSEPGVYEAGRRWITERMAEQGVYREPHFVVDVFLAHAYADYMRALSSGMGLLNADFGGKNDPLEVVQKLLGIDQPRRTESRVKKALH
ncbi:MAG: hypothetical protein M0Z44_07800 [Gammaproteobacteria bacterium]|nr:hypothetical protein [Gammaproteobacteria bacterium]